MKNHTRISEAPLLHLLRTMHEYRARGDWMIDQLRPAWHPQRDSAICRTLPITSPSHRPVNNRPTKPLRAPSSAGTLQIKNVPTVLKIVVVQRISLPPENPFHLPSGLP
ncbi:MAG: hypothetical protein ACK5NE_07710 [Brachymonas sp.]